MKKFFTTTISVLSLISSNVFNQVNYNNPILAGFYPDPSICRVGNDYYITTSTFAYFPGLPVIHSTDLVNWQQVGNAMDRNEQLDNPMQVFQEVYLHQLYVIITAYFISSAH
jgi:xylan 1,4-beta-xylosidase